MIHWNESGKVWERDRRRVAGLDGEWVHESDGTFAAAVRGHTMKFPNQAWGHFFIHRSKLTTVIHGCAAKVASCVIPHKAVIEHGRIKWSDGDVWWRKDDLALEADEHEAMLAQRFNQVDLEMRIHQQLAKGRAEDMKSVA